MNDFSLSGQLVDIVHSRIFPATVHVENGKIIKVLEDPSPKTPYYILPGFIDSHIHIESSMLIPSEFARLATPHGTVATVSDPHEIGNVLGIEGVRFMIENGKKVPFHFYFGAPSCVPATQFETAGSQIRAQDIETLFLQNGLKYLSEMMNFPGVLHNDSEVLKKIEIAKKLKKPIDGHAPGLKGDAAKQYAEAGITTDHECFELEEALEKIQYGMHILIREGSAAKNYEALHPLIGKFPTKVMFCSDDKHPHELVKGHINQLVKKSIIEKKYALMDVLRIASLNPIKHYQLDVGLLQSGDSADFILVNNLTDFTVLETYIQGQKVSQHGKTLIPRLESTAPNHFDIQKKKPTDFLIQADGTKIKVIQPKDGQLITECAYHLAKISNGYLIPDIQQDILKLTVVNRYFDAKPAVAFIQNFGLKRGAIASCIAHDSHNIIAVGCSDEEICTSVNLIIENQGGIACVDGSEAHVLPLPVAGIMSKDDGYEVAKKYAEIESHAKKLGSKLTDPFMTLSFMALLVIPQLKLSDRGLFDGKTFTFTSLQS